MGQYHKPFNLDKKQKLHPHKFGCGLKLAEQMGGGVTDALLILLAASNGRGGGDFQDESPLIGSWAGDRIAWIGDYAEADDIPGCDAEAIYQDETYEDISDQVIPILERENEAVYVGDGWRTCVFFSHIEGYGGSHGRGDRHIIIGGQEYSSQLLRARLKEKIKGHPPEKITADFLGLEDLPMK